MSSHPVTPACAATQFPSPRSLCSSRHRWNVRNHVRLVFTQRSSPWLLGPRVFTCHRQGLEKRRWEHTPAAGGSRGLSVRGVCSGSESGEHRGRRESLPSPNTLFYVTASRGAEPRREQCGALPTPRGNPRLRQSHPNSRAAPPPSATVCQWILDMQEPYTGLGGPPPSSQRGDGPAAAFLTRPEGGLPSALHHR